MGIQAKGVDGREQRFVRCLNGRHLDLSFHLIKGSCLGDKSYTIYIYIFFFKLYEPAKSILWMRIFQIDYRVNMAWNIVRTEH
jgi:hypothetical protein